MQKPSFTEVLSNWQHLADAGKRPATKCYHAELVQIFKTHFPKMDSPVDEISTSDIVQFVQRVAHYSAPRYNALISVIKSTIPNPPKLRRRSVTPRVVQLPDNTQFSAILRELDNAVRGNGGLTARFLALTGLRIKEARQVRWCDVKEDCLILPGAVTKNGKPRPVPMIEGLRDVLSQFRATGPSEREFILCHASIKTALNNACKRAGVPRITHHDFRRLYATRCIESGVDVPTVARWMGHRDGGALLSKTYFHLMDGHSRAMAQKVKIAA